MYDLVHLDPVYLSDPNVSPDLLPEYMTEHSNTIDINAYKNALNVCIRTRLNDEQQELLHERYWQQKPLRDIARVRGTTSSCISKKIKKAESIIYRYVSFYMEVHEQLKHR